MAAEESRLLVPPRPGGDGEAPSVPKPKAMAPTNDLLAAIVDSSQDAIISRNLEGVITSWNKGAERLFGYMAEEALGQHVTFIVPPHSLQEEEAILDRVRRGERIDHFESVRLRKDGTPVAVSLTISPVRDFAGNIVGSSKVVRDITQKRVAERALLTGLGQQKALFRLADELHRSESYDEIYIAGLDAIYAALHCDRASILLHDNDRVMRFVKWRGLSDGYRKLTEGHSPWPLGEKKPLPIWINDADQADFPKVLESALKEEGIRGLAFIPLVSMGQLVGKFMTYFDVPHVYTEDEIAISLTIAQQIVFAIDRKRAYESLRKSEERFRELSETLETEVRKRTQELESRSQQLGELSRKLLRTQDDERRRISRELHDSAGEILTLLGINLGSMRAANFEPQFDHEVQQAERLVERLSQTIRTTSYLLHPPMLDQMGLPVALSWHVSGLAERSGLDIRLDIPEDFGRLSPGIELMIFRLVQECLTNVYRHSASKNATITLKKLDDNVVLKVADEGKGISPEELLGIHSHRAGVGFQGMRERVREFGGEMSIDSNGRGTIVSFTLPQSQSTENLPSSI